MTNLEQDVGTYTYQKLQGPDRESRCFEKAEIWLESKFAFCGREKKDIPENDLIQEILMKRAAYELFAMAEQEGLALDKKEDALELLAGILGPRVFQSTFTESPPPSPEPRQAAAVIQQKESRWDAYG